LWYKQFSKKKRLKEIINYLEITRKNSFIGTEEKKEVNKKIFIPQETENAILNKLKRFESSSRFTNKEMSLAVLAGQLDTNTKYLSEIINNHYNMNFNSYINKLRINFIVSKLKSDANFINYKISYLAETCGFSSHSSFATVFKSITGITPITFIELLKKEKGESLTSNSDYNDI
jgi:AraC-like DNA-binding protein